MSHEPIVDEWQNSLTDFSKGLNFPISSCDLDGTASTREMSREIAKHKVFQHQFFLLFEKSFQDKSDKNHFQKQIKHSKKFWFNQQAIEHTHITFKHVQSHK